ncbi:MAG TPA: Kdo hydroxylase family protein [Candidatus Binataceae bacterium]|nr:Kdo hydroxylase family protein [Candidatus Binataceae bacterium]
MGVIEITTFTELGWSDPDAAPERARCFCERLERGDILLLHRFPVIGDDERRLLTEVRQAGSSFVKNISYDAASARLRGFARRGTDAATLARVLAGYSDRMGAVAAELLAPYADGLEPDVTSFRPIEERGRNLRGRSRNDLIHVDSFPTRPARGRRILRFFTNVNPREPRVWVTAQTFEELARAMALEAGLVQYASAAGGMKARLKRAMTATLRGAGIKSPERSRYDEFMLRFHDYLKGNQKFQRDCYRQRYEFPAGSTWIAMTDMVPHAVLSGRHALEQTFFVPIRLMLTPEKSPLRILESIAGAVLA